jgi:hypothetical protein
MMSLLDVVWCETQIINIEMKTSDLYLSKVHKDIHRRPDVLAAAMIMDQLDVLADCLVEHLTAPTAPPPLPKKK